MDIAVADHAEEFAGHFEIVGVNDAVLDRESGFGLARETVAGTGNDRGDQLRERTENGDGEDVALGDFRCACALHGAGIATGADPLIRAAQEAMLCLIFKIKISQAREIDAVESEVRLVALVVSGQGNVGATADLAVKKFAVDIDQLETVVGEEEPAGNPLEREVLAEENVIHSARRIDFDLDVIIRAALKMVDAVDQQIRRVAEFVIRDFLEIFRIDPDDGFGETKRGLDLLEADFMMRKIVGDRSGAGAFVAEDAEIVEMERALFEPQRRARFVHPRAAESGALGGDGSFAGPGGRIAARAMQRETNGRRPAPNPFRKEAAHLG